MLRTRYLLSLSVALGLLPIAAHADIAACISKEQTSTGNQVEKYINDTLSLSDSLDGVGSILATVKRGGRKDECILLCESDGTMTEAVCTGDSLPAEVGSLEIKRIDQPKISADAASVTWIGIAAGGSQGIFTTDLVGVPYDKVNFSTTTRVATGNEIPGTGNGVVSSIISGGVNSTGDLFFTAKLSLPPGTVRASYKDGVLAGCASGNDCFTTNSLFEKGKQEGDNLKGATVCEFVGDVSVSDYGVAFKATTDSENDPPAELGSDICLQFAAGPNTSIVEGVFRVAGVFSTYDKIAEAGDESNPSPSPAGTQYASFRSSPVMTDTGDMCFIASTQGVIRLTYVYCCAEFTCPSELPVNVLADRSTSFSGDKIRVFKDFDVSEPGYLAVQTTKGVFGGSGAFSGAISPVYTLATRKDVIDGYEIKTFKPGVALGADATTGNDVAFQGLAKGDGRPKNRNVVFTAELP